MNTKQYLVKKQLIEKNIYIINNKWHSLLFFVDYQKDMLRQLLGLPIYDFIKSILAINIPIEVFFKHNRCNQN